MNATTGLFSPLSLDGLVLPNRIVIPPMDQYSADNGAPTDWHYVHYGHLALSGAGMLIVEATAVVPEGRISPQDMGIWNEAHEAAHKKMLAFIRSFSAIPMAVQLAHAGRKASEKRPWEGKGAISPDQGGWQPVAPSAIAHDADHPAPRPLTLDEIGAIPAAFAAAAQRAVRAGYQVLEIHAAHGYLLHEFLSPLSNTRTDAYGGDLENRMRLPLSVFQAVREAVPREIPVGVRVSGTDFVPGKGWDIEQCVIFAQELDKRGCSYIHVSGGGLAAEQQIALYPGYQLPFAARIKAAVAMPVIAVGLITEPELAASIVAGGQADMVAIGRGMLFDPRWPWRAAAALRVTLDNVPRQYLRSEPHRLRGLFQ
jgi:2,4-dienoyl-CoA reductase-like NADH-dependent reductase (Old Yellow Enzyme family)